MEPTTDPTTTPSPESTGVHFARLKVVGTWVIGSLIALSGMSDADLVVLFGAAWGPRVRGINLLLLGGFYATERYITRSGTWYKADEK